MWGVWSSRALKKLKYSLLLSAIALRNYNASFMLSKLSVWTMTRWTTLKHELIVNNYTHFTENKCEMAQPLQGDGESEEVHDAFISDGCPTNQWNKIKCDASLRGSRSLQRRSCLCDFLARCFSEDNNITCNETCPNERLKSSLFGGTASNVNIELEVVRCRPFEPSTERVFSIRASEGKRNCVVKVYMTLFFYLLDRFLVIC